MVVPFKCDVHGWMNAYVGVLDHPYFAVTKPDGSFSIPNLPPGSYTLAAWHERLGTQTHAGDGCGEGIEVGRQLHVQGRRGSELVTRGSRFWVQGSRGRTQHLDPELEPEPEPDSELAPPPCGFTVTRNSSQPPQSF